MDVNIKFYVQMLHVDIIRSRYGAMLRKAHNTAATKLRLADDLLSRQLHFVSDGGSLLNYCDYWPQVSVSLSLCLFLSLCICLSRPLGLSLSVSISVCLPFSLCLSLSLTEVVEQCVNSSKHQFADGPAGCTPMAFTLDKASGYHKSLGLNVSVYHVDPFWSTCSVQHICSRICM